MVKCISFREHKSGSLLGFADIKVLIDGDEATIFGCSMYEKDGKKWVNVPSKEIVKDGVKSYLPFMKFDNRDISDKFSRKIQDAIKLFQSSNVSTDEFFTQEVPF